MKTETLVFLGIGAVIVFYLYSKNRTAQQNYVMSASPYGQANGAAPLYAAAMSAATGVVSGVGNSLSNLFSGFGNASNNTTMPTETYSATNGVTNTTNTSSS